MNRSTPVKLSKWFGWLRPRRRWLRFSLSTLLIAVTLCCVWLGIAARRNHARQAAFAEIERQGGAVSFHLQDKEDGPTTNIAPEPTLWERISGTAYAEVNGVHLGPGELSDEAFAEIAKFRDLVSFSTRQPDFSDERLLQLRRHTKIAQLSLANTQVTDTGLEALSGMPNLVSVTLNGTRIKGPGLVHLADKSSLQYLHLHHTLLGDDGPRHLADLKKIDVLDLSETNIGDAGLEELAGMTHLTKLVLTGTRVTDAGLAHLSEMKNLQYLTLAKTRVTGTGLAHLADLPSISQLDLNDSEVCDAGVRDLPLLPHVKYIFLSGSRVGDAGAAWLARLPKLITLYAAETQIGDAGAVALAGAPSLSYLDLSHCDIGDAGFLALSAMNMMAELNMNDTLVADAALDAATSRPANIRLSGTLATQAGVDRFVARLGGLPPIDWQVRPRDDKSAEAEQFTALALIGDGDSAESLWLRAIILWHAASPAEYPRLPKTPRDKIDALFAAAFERSDRQAPILTAWGDTSPAPERVRSLMKRIESKLAGHPHEDLLRRLLLTDRPAVTCNVIAAAFDSSYAPAWERLAIYASEEARQATAALVACDADNAMSHYWRATLLRHEAEPEELAAWLEAGHAAPRVEGYPTPLPPNIIDEALLELAPALDSGVVMSSGQIQFFDGFAPFFSLAGNPTRERWNGYEPELAKSLAKMLARVRDASFAAHATSFSRVDLDMFLSSAETLADRGAGASAAQAAKARLAWRGVLDWAVPHRNSTAFVRFDHFFHDLREAKKKWSQEFRDVVRAKGFDGPLEWLPEIDK